MPTLAQAIQRSPRGPNNNAQFVREAAPVGTFIGACFVRHVNTVSHCKGRVVIVERSSSNGHRPMVIVLSVVQILLHLVQAHRGLHALRAGAALLRGHGTAVLGIQRKGGGGTTMSSDLDRN